MRPRINADERRSRPILFSGPMVRAILEGRKTQTRRVIRPQPQQYAASGGVGLSWGRKCGGGSDWLTKWCPYGAPGDRLWVRETWAKVSGPGGSVRYYATDDVHELRKKRPSIHMPRRYSRITLEITDVRVQRVQDISEEDAKAEGCSSADPATGRECILTPEHGSFRLHYQSLWDSINAKRGFPWDSNPWVWAITFRHLRSSASIGGEK